MKSLAILVLSLALIGCGRDVPVEPEEPTQPRYIGQITSIHAAQSFVLIRRAPGITLAAGTILISRGPGDRVANLRVSGETLGLMTAADIQAGVPEVGDSVYEPLLEKPELTPDSAPESP